jgi:hypothetical protein
MVTFMRDSQLIIRDMRIGRRDRYFWTSIILFVLFERHGGSWRSSKVGFSTCIYTLLLFMTFTERLSRTVDTRSTIHQAGIYRAHQISPNLFWAHHAVTPNLVVGFCLDN